MPKVYQATFLLGCTSDSDDVETEVHRLDSLTTPAPEEIEDQLPKFLGRIHQRPPAYSAIKIGGQRAYQLARKGQEVNLEPRTVCVHALQITKYAYPTLEVKIRCGSGFYVRSFGRDLAESLGTSAVMAALTRTAVGDFRFEDSIDADRLNKEVVASRLRPAICAVSHLPQMTLNAEQIEDIHNGRQIPVPIWQVPELQRLVKNSTLGVLQKRRSDSKMPTEVAALDKKDNLVAILQEKRLGMLGPVCNFPYSE